MKLDEVDFYILEALNREMSLVQMKKFLAKKTRKEIPSRIIAQKLKKLKNYGYLVNRCLNENGIYFTLGKDNDYSRTFNINCSQFLKFIMISDTHIGNTYDDIYNLNRVYDYASNNSIRFIFHIGDLIEGLKPNRESYARIPTTHEQVKEVIKKYPKKDDISTGILLGNHDKYSIEQIGFDIREELESKRLDIITFGYISSSVAINNRNMVLYHSSGISSSEGRIKFLNLPNNSNADVVFSGHCHTGFMLMHDDIPFIFVPPMFKGKKCNRVESAYECKIASSEGNNNLDTLKISPLVLSDEEIYPVTTVEYKLRKQ